MAYRVFRFENTSPKLIGFAESGTEAERLFGLEHRAYLAAIKGEGICYTCSADDDARATWNLPIKTPQIPTS